MGPLLRLALALAVHTVSQRGQRSAARLASIAALAMAAATCAVAAVACALASLWIYALPFAGAAGAPLIVAGVLVVVCAALLGMMRYRLKRRARPASGVTPAMLHAEATRLLREHKASTLLAAVLAGIVAGMERK